MSVGIFQNDGGRVDVRERYVNRVALDHCSCWKDITRATLREKHLQAKTSAVDLKGLDLYLKA